MIAHDSRGTPEHARVLSPPVAHRLREAIGEWWRAPEGPASERAEADLAAALVVAATEARDRSLHPEALILAIKALEGEVAGSTVHLARDERRALRAWLVSACIRAYFNDP